MLSYTLFKALTFPVTYLLVAILILTAVMQIKYLNRALSRFDATQVIPTQFVLFTLSVIIGSAVLYRDFERTSAEKDGGTQTRTRGPDLRDSRPHAGGVLSPDGGA